MFGKLRKGKMGQNMVGGTIGVVFSLFVLVVMLFAFSIAGAELNDTTNNSDAETVISDGQSGMQSFSGLLTAIFVIAAIGLLITILVAAVGGVMRRQ
jgi:uncharacterized YccA/Bax inhibitor family protein